VYVIALTRNPQEDTALIPRIEHLPDPDRARWIQNEPVVYVGQTTRQTLSRRISQFYSHKYGRKSPHSGGQAVKLLDCELWVYWSPCANPKAAERAALDGYRTRRGQLPFANRRRS